jgi:protein disulfide isomerase family A protein 3
MFELSPKDFDKVTYSLNQELAGNTLSLVLFYAPWCHHCVEFMPIWRKVFSKVAFANIYQFNSEEYSEFLRDINDGNVYEINGFPTIVIFNKGQFLSYYEGSRDAKTIIKDIYKMVSES